MPDIRLHCVNVIEPRNRGARKHNVKLRIVAASSPEDAMAQVARASHDDDLLLYRNDFEPGAVITWAHQSWDKDDYADAEKRGVFARAIAPRDDAVESH